MLDLEVPQATILVAADNEVNGSCWGVSRTETWGASSHTWTMLTASLFSGLSKFKPRKAGLP